MPHRTIIAASIAFGLTACTIPTAPTPNQLATSSPTVLTEQQLQIVQDSVKSIIKNPQSAKFSPAKARSELGIAGAPRIHVCGHVSYNDPAKNAVLTAPYYIELDTVSAITEAIRGQVGTDPSKRAKVVFICRDHQS